MKTGHFYFAENRTFSFCLDKADPKTDLEIEDKKKNPHG